MHSARQRIADDHVSYSRSLSYRSRHRSITVAVSTSPSCRRKLRRMLPRSLSRSPSDGDDAGSNTSWALASVAASVASTSSQPTLAKKKRAKKTQFCLDVQEECWGVLTGSSCKPHVYIPIPLHAANMPLYGSCKLESRSVSQIRLHTLICVGDELHIGSKHVTHRLEISFGYARHYLDVFRLMSNLQVTCVNDCITYVQLMAHVCGTYEPYAGIRRNFLCMHKHFWRPRRTTNLPACFSVLLTYTKLTHNLFDVRQRIRQFFHTLAYAS